MSERWWLEKGRFDLQQVVWTKPSHTLGLVRQTLIAVCIILICFCIGVGACYRSIRLALGNKTCFVLRIVSLLLSSMSERYFLLQQNFFWDMQKFPWGEVVHTPPKRKGFLGALQSVCALEWKYRCDLQLAPPVLKHAIPLLC